MSVIVSVYKNIEKLVVEDATIFLPHISAWLQSNKPNVSVDMFETTTDDVRLDRFAERINCAELVNYVDHAVLLTNFPFEYSDMENILIFKKKRYWLLQVRPDKTLVKTTRRSYPNSKSRKNIQSTDRQGPINLPHMDDDWHYNHPPGWY